MALVLPEHWTRGFVFADAGGTTLAATTSLVGARWWQGFMRDADGRLVVSAGPGTKVAGLVRDASGALVVTGGQTSPPLYPFA